VRVGPKAGRAEQPRRGAGGWRNRGAGHAVEERKTADERTSGGGGAAGPASRVPLRGGAGTLLILALALRLR
jgi:hypothetical protein